MRIWLKLFAVWLVGVALLVVAAWWLLRTDYGVGVDSVRWLPPEARAISYLRFPYHNTWAEFAIDRQAFEQWCRSIDKPLRRLGPNERKGVRRCRRSLEDGGVVAAVPAPNKNSEQWPAWYDRRMEKKLGQGDLYYEEVWRNGGGYWIG
jgi:hypothetical protein